MEVSKEFTALIGSNIYFRTCDGEFEGIVKSVSLEKKQISVRNVYDRLQNVRIGDSTFFIHQFLSYSTVNKLKYSEIRKSEMSLNSKMSFSKGNCNTTVSCKEKSSKLTSAQCVAKKDLNFSDFALKLPPDLQHVLPNDFVVLDSIDFEFRCATNYISQQSVIGVSFQGNDISRRGKLFWICISTNYCVFLFDIQELRRSAFDNGLRNILQNQNIVKVIHDSRRPFDCLYHIFSTTLSNVFDIQVADLVSKQKIGSKSDFLNEISLNKCLENYLAVPKEFLYVSKMVVEGNYFSKRPLDNECLNILIKDTVYLVMLRKKLTKLMLNSVYKTSDFYLKVIAESPKLTSELSYPSTIPSALIEQGLEIFTLQKDYLKSSVTTVTDLKYSQKESQCEAKLSERNNCKNVASNFDCCSFSISNNKQVRKSNTGIPETLQTLVNDVKQKCLVASKEFSRGKIHDNQKFRYSATKMTSLKKDESQTSGSSNYAASKTDFPNSNFKKCVKDKLLVAVSSAETNAYSKLGQQAESNDKHENAFNVINNSFSDYSETWKKLRSTCDASNSTNMTMRKSNIKFIPSGMNC